MRISTQSIYARVLSGLQFNFGGMLRAQEQLSSGLRLIRPSDDPTGAAQVLRYERDLAGIARAQKAIGAGHDALESGASQVQSATGLLSEARSLLLEAMNGTLDAESRKIIGNQLTALRDQLLDIANARLSERYLFGGSETENQPFIEIDASGEPRVVYQGNDLQQELDIGGMHSGINVPGSDVFGKLNPGVPSFSGETGVKLGATANQGTGYEYLEISHLGTTGAGLAAQGIALHNAGADDTFIGTGTLVIDAVAETIQFGDGEPQQLPAAGAPELAHVQIGNSGGGVLHLDLSSWDGNSFSGDVSAQSAVSFGGSEPLAIDGSETDLKLTAPESSNILHIDASSIQHTGEEQVQYSGAINVFDTLQAAIDNLSDAENFSSAEIVERLDMQLAEVDRHMNSFTSALGIFGSKSQNLEDSAGRFLDLETHVRERLGDVQDVDVTKVVLELQQSEYALQLSQAAGSRLLSTSLLDYLR